MRRAEKERLKEGEMADEEQTKLKKEAVRKEAAKKKGSSTAGSKDVSSKSSTKKKNNVSDGDHSPTEADDNETAAATVDTEDDDDIQWQTDTSAEAARQRIQEQLSSVTAGMVMLSTNEERPKSVKNSPERDEDKTQSKVNGHSNGVKVDYSNSCEKLACLSYQHRTKTHKQHILG